ncbi:selenocysteine-specific translation elongation factor [Actinoplanes philippinensis]|uniref:Selenocysteine-specific elongation factor n=1 Tax=Actinoplanes philippinensis TaxID=35752 RepID=A0A1I2HNI2_9ACTN|nr:selenocysteine-specific translation elongation factor [Actinoplanes philippinensis]GIE74129.1 selenocysteine-specific translation elongation factor [Actinoplanes philippinensis]SFF30860.1 selenocysteine-specific elongation factor [Actinoplanes philippinensis]
MHVVATAGHVDHGKSTLVRALTGMEPDRWAEERRRGMTIDLGFAWTTLPSGASVAFVDVPGHERFVPNMLAGIGPVPAAMIVVAADEGWKPQSAEHLAALDALGVRHGLLVVTRSDLAGPGSALADATARIAATSLGTVEAVAVSGHTGAGLDDLRAALDRLTAALPASDTTAPVRLWIDRAFTIRGAGTVVTGTLGAGLLRTGDELELTGAGPLRTGGDLKRGGAGRLRSDDDLRLSGPPRRVRVRGLQSLGAPAGEVAAVARVAVNLRGVDRDSVTRGAALLTPGRFRLTGLVDVRVHGDAVADLPATVTLHTGSAAVPVRVRPLGTDTARLRLGRPLPLRLGDRALLRDPGRHHVAGGVTVLDADPPTLGRRGAAAGRAADLTGMGATADPAGELRRRRLIRREDLLRLGVPADVEPVAGDWLADPAHWDELRRRLADEVARHATDHPLEPGAPLDALRHRLGLPDRALVEALVQPPLRLRDGRVTAGDPGVPAALAGAVRRAFADLTDRPFTAPEAHRLTELGLGTREVGAAVRAGLAVRLDGNVLLPPDTPTLAVRVLAALPQPFTLSEARRALDTTRRVAVPLLELLDRTGVTERLPDDRRRIRPAVGPQ